MEHFLRAIWRAVSRAAVLILPQINLNSQFSRCALFSPPTERTTWEDALIRKQMWLDTEDGGVLEAGIRGAGHDHRRGLGSWFLLLYCLQGARVVHRDTRQGLTHCCWPVSPTCRTQGQVSINTGWWGNLHPQGLHREDPLDTGGKNKMGKKTWHWNLFAEVFSLEWPCHRSVLCLLCEPQRLVCHFHIKLDVLQLNCNCRLPAPKLLWGQGRLSRAGLLYLQQIIISYLTRAQI